MDIQEKLGKFTKDDALAIIGLETRRSVMDYLLPAMGIFATGIVVGAGLGLLFAPKSGRELRAEIGDQAGALKEMVGRRVESIGAKLEG